MMNLKTDSYLIDLNSTADDVTICDGTVFQISAVGESYTSDQFWIAFKWWLNIDLIFFPLVDPNIIVSKTSDLKEKFQTSFYVKNFLTEIVAATAQE